MGSIIPYGVFQLFTWQYMVTVTFIRQRKDRRIVAGSLYHAIPSHHFVTLTHCTCLVTFNLKMKITLITLPETNIAPEKMVSQKERIVFQPSIFGCYCYVRFRDPVSPIKNTNLFLTTCRVKPPHGMQCQPLEPQCPGFGSWDPQKWVEGDFEHIITLECQLFPGNGRP